MPVDLFLLRLKTSKGTSWNWLLCQVLVALGRVTDAFVEGAASTSDAVSAMVKSAAAKADEDALDSLVMGEGIQGEKVDDPAALCASAKALGV
eukprot:1436018-Lingulodinium_polyedra.AAC.1